MFTSTVTMTMTMTMVFLEAGLAGVGEALGLRNTTTHRVSFHYTLNTSNHCLAPIAVMENLVPIQKSP